MRPHQVMTQVVSEHQKCLNKLSWYDARFLQVLYNVTNSFLLREPTPSFYAIHFTNWCAKCLFYFYQDCSLLSGSFALEALLIAVHYKKRYINIHVQYNTIAIECALHKEFHHKTFWPSGRYSGLLGYNDRLVSRYSSLLGI